MAIIYTYPKLSNPDGTELIVVSDPSDQNNTKLVAISTIASLVPSSAGGTVTSVALDFSPATGDTGLRLAALSLRGLKIVAVVTAIVIPKLTKIQVNMIMVGGYS